MPAIHLEHAVALQAAGQQGEPNNEAYQELLHAHRLISQDTRPEIVKHIFKSLTYSALYFDPPAGFDAAIRWWTLYQKDPRQLPSGGIWVNVACAYGQKARWIKSQAPPGRPLSAADKASFDEARGNCLEAIKNALAIEPYRLHRLQLLFKPDHDEKKSDPERYQNENDLEVFANDPEFSKVLGLSSAAP